MQTPQSLPIEEIVSRYVSGSSIHILAGQFKVGKARLREILDEAGVLRSAGQSISLGFQLGTRAKSEWKRKGKDIDDSQLVSLFSKGMNPSEISAELNVAMRRVQSRLSELNLINGKGKHLCEECGNVCEGHAGRKRCRTCVPDDFAGRFLKYGINKRQFDSMVKEQGGHCALCDGPPYCIDHDHKTGAIRGVLCTVCNMSMAAIDRDVTWGDRAMAYKRKFSQ